MAEDEIEKKIKAVYVWMVLGGMAVGGVGGTGVLRVDKFTGSDAELMRKELLLEIKRVQLECNQRIQQSESDKPPGLTRQRIQALEQSAQRTDPAYKQPTWEWK